MLTHANIKSFLLALPLAAMFCLGCVSNGWADRTLSAEESQMLLEAKPKILAYYKDNNIEAEKVDENILKLLDSSVSDDFFRNGKQRIGKVKTALQYLASFTGEKGAFRFNTDTSLDENNINSALYYVNIISNELDSLQDSELISVDDAQAIKNYASSLYGKGSPGSHGSS